MNFETLRSHIGTIFRDELRDLAERAVVEDLVVLRLEWDYDEDLSYDVMPCFTTDRFMIVYSEGGFGPESPWGVLENGAESCGPDAIWHGTLELAMSMLANDIKFAASSSDSL